MPKKNIKVIKTVINGAESLTSHKFNKNANHIKILCDIPELDFKNLFINVFNIDAIKLLKVENKLIESIPMLPNLEKLIFRDCSKLSVLPILPKLKKLKITGQNDLKDLPIFPELEKLYLCEFNGQVHLGKQPNVHTLKLINMICVNLPNMPNLDTLILDNANINIESKSSLGITNLCVKNCDDFSIILLECFRELKYLEIESSYIDTIPVLPNLIDLDLTNTLHVKSILNQPNLLNLNIFGASITSLPSFPNLSTLKLFSCDTLTSLPTFPKITYLDFENCDMIRTIPCYTSLETLTYSNYNVYDGLSATGLREIPRLPNVKSVHIEGYSLFTSLPDFPSIKNLTLSHCKDIFNIPKLPSLTYLYIYNTENLNPYSIPLKFVDVSKNDVLNNLEKYIEYNEDNVVYLQDYINNMPEIRNVYTNNLIEKINKVLDENTLVKPANKFIS